MSQQEMDQMDRECEDVVNSAATPEAKAAAEAIAEEWCEENAPKVDPDPCSGTAKTEPIADWYERKKREKEAIARQEKNRRRVCLALRVILCLLLGAFFVAVLVAPALVIWLVNAGVLCCGIVAAIAIDRYRRR